jgi:uncharacterized protein
MKFLLLLCVFMFAIWLFRSRNPSRESVQTGAKREPEQIAVKACAWCGVHGVEAELIQGRRGLYCSVEHLQLAQDKASRG